MEESPKSGRLREREEESWWLEGALCCSGEAAKEDAGEVFDMAGARAMAR